MQGLGSSQLADHLVNEINQGPCYVNELMYSTKTTVQFLVTVRLEMYIFGSRKNQCISKSMQLDLNSISQMLAIMTSEDDLTDSKSL